MANTTTQIISLPLGPKKELIKGTLITNKNGDAEWYEGIGLGKQTTPSFTSNKADNYEWKSSPNCVQGVTCPDADKINRFINSNSKDSLNQGRLTTFNSPNGFNSPQLAKDLKLPGTKNTGSASEEIYGNLNPITVNEITPNSRKKYENYYYPKELASNGKNQSTKQDRVKFSMREVESFTINPKFGEKNITRNIGTIIGSVTLPIQPGLGDSNNVDWQGPTMDALESYLAGGAMNLMQKNNLEGLFGGTLSMGKDLANSILSGASAQGYQEAMRIAIAQQAVGIQGLLSRATGSILNPNMELLFNGPSLRTFNYAFRLSPRDSTEADYIRKIIRFFKQGMSVKTTSSSVFLRTPNVFDITYTSFDNDGKEIKNHPSLNRIKTCALVGCDVDYTPDGTYMTYNEPKRSMTSYSLSLRFSELEPIYDSDYSDADGKAVQPYNISPDEIGF